MNPKNTLINNFAKESLARQEKILEKTSQIKAHANLLQAKEKKQMRMTGMKLIPLSSRDGPRSQDKHPIDLASSFSTNPEKNSFTTKTSEKSKTQSSEFKYPEPEPNEEEKSPTIEPSIIKVNPKIDLSLLFFDEERPDWSDQ